MYDVFGKRRVQLKVGPGAGNCFEVGDKVGYSDDLCKITIPDGIYIGYNGVVVIKDQIFVAEFGTEEVFTKWGGSFSVDIAELNPLQGVISEAEKKYASKEEESSDADTLGMLTDKDLPIRVQVAVEMQIAAVEQGSSFTEARLKHAVRMAVENAISHAEGRGFSHPLYGSISLSFIQTGLIHDA